MLRLPNQAVSNFFAPAAVNGDLACGLYSAPRPATPMNLRPRFLASPRVISPADFDRIAISRRPRTLGSHPSFGIRGSPRQHITSQAWSRFEILSSR
jgi:hypothetical protein